MVSDQTTPHSSPLVIAASPDEALPAGMVREEFRAMGTTVTLLLPLEQAGNQIVQKLFEEWEQTLSRFRTDSELSQLNAHSGQPVFVSELLCRVVEAALAAARATDGIYDPTLLTQMQRIGYQRSFDALPAEQPASVYDGQAGGGWRAMQVNHATRCIVLPRAVQLDFGGIGKGMAVDASIEALRQAGIERAMVNAGGDLAVLGLTPQDEAWSIAVPLKEGSRTLLLHRGAIATSGIARRHWAQGNVQRHHLLDPRDGLPAASGLWSVTVVAEQCEQAEVAAKVAFVLGAQEGRTFLERHHLPGLLVATDGTWHVTSNWPLQHM